MDSSGAGRDSRYLSYGMGMMGSGDATDVYGRPSTSQLAGQIGRAAGGATVLAATQRGIKRQAADAASCYETGGGQMSAMPGESLAADNLEDSFAGLTQPKKSPPSNGKKTKGRVKIKMEYIDNKLRRYTTFSKRKTGIMKKVSQSVSVSSSTSSNCHQNKLLHNKQQLFFYLLLKRAVIVVCQHNMFYVNQLVLN